ncbi:MAG: hypothetical protein HZB51_07715 [Chloroflexi bacterium]|nr:hypothetical protein [Chloroflexota bacterium]
MELRTLDELSNDLSPHARSLITQIIQQENACQLLDLFQQRPRTWLEPEDIAFHLHCSLDQIDQALAWLSTTQVVQLHSILGFKFYGLTEDSEILNALERFWSWRDNWLTHLERVKDNLYQQTTRHALAAWVEL